MARVETINALPQVVFHGLPPEEQELAGEVWTARVVDINLRRMRERWELVRREREIAETP